MICPGAGKIFATAVLFVVTYAMSACMTSSEPLTPSDGPWRFSGAIKTLSGSNIAGARLTVLTGANATAHVTTGADGRYLFENLSGGRFNVLIEASGFASIQPRVDLFRDIEANFALASAP